MDINKLSNQINRKLNGTETPKSGEKASDSTSSKSTTQIADKVSLESFKSRNNEFLFAKLELEKLNESSSERLNDFKTKVIEYRETRKRSPEEAKKTEIGNKINNPSIWQDIAHKIVK